MAGRAVLHYLHVLAGRELPQTQTTDAEHATLVSHLPGRKRIGHQYLRAHVRNDRRFEIIDRQDSQALCHSSARFFRK